MKRPRQAKLPRCEYPMSVPDRHEINAHEVAHRIGEILHYLWDPIGVRGIPEARDEYDSYVAHVGALLERGGGKRDITD